MESIVAVLGTTGAGKSQLALDLATRLDGEVVSVDALQVYRGLDVATNKVTQAERARAPHHLLDVCEPPAEFTVQDFVREARRIIDEIRARGRLPILVGGTHYYLQTLVWNTIVEQNSVDGAPDDDNAANDDEDRDDPRYSHARLREIDPAMAERYHPNDRRRIHRSIQVFEQLGRRHSEIVAENERAQMQYRVCFLWPATEPIALDVRLDGRCETMLQNGLVEELRAFHRRFPPPHDYRRGIFQAIGFKEFDEYLDLADDQQNTPRGRVLLDKGFERLRQATRRYARKQVTWITGRLGRALARAPASQYHFHIIDTTDTSRWADTVVPRAVDMVQRFLRHEAPASIDESAPHAAVMIELLTKPPAVEQLVVAGVGTAQTCDMCHRTLHGEKEWVAHLLSRAHRQRARDRERRDRQRERKKKRQRDASAASASASSADEAGAPAKP